jgi:putative membrane protein
MRTTMEKLVLSFLMCFALTANAGKVTPSDSEIVGVVATANSGEIQAAELAAQKATHPEVKQFAQQMLTEHTAMNKESQALAAKLGLKSEDSVTSKTLNKKSQADLKKLKELQGAEFDKEYVGDQVLMHKLVLETIENVLIPSADNAELKAMLKTAQGKVSTHLQHAKQLKDKYDK